MANKRSSLIANSYSTLAVFILFIAWQSYALYIDNSILVPKPIEVIERFIELFTESHTYLVILQSFKRLVFSLAISVVLGSVLGLASGLYYRVEAFLRPLVILARSLPVLAIIVVVLILFGNVGSLYVISFLLIFPIIYQAELDGMKHINKLLLDALRLDSDGIDFQALRLVYFPLSLPFLRTAIIESIGLGIKVLVVAEYIAQTKVSMGREIYLARINLHYEDVFAWSLIILFIVLLIEGIVEKRLKTARRK